MSKWTHVDKKEPEFGKQYALSLGQGDWEKGDVIKIETTSAGKSMTAYIPHSDDNGSGYKYWMEIIAPNDKE